MPPAILPAAMRTPRFLAPWQRQDLPLPLDSLQQLGPGALASLRGKPALYHCLSRVVNRDRVLGPEEREHFVHLMRLYERFCRVRVLTFAVMSNHFHLLLEVPARPEHEPSDHELLEHLAILYSKAQVAEIRQQLQRHRDHGLHDDAEELRQKFLGRMYNLSAYMKIVKQRFTQWFNKKHQRSGTLWEDRFKSSLVEDGHAARVVAAYIDLNPLRAGMVEDPRHYRWCGYAEAVAGRKAAREGLRRVLFEQLSTVTSEARAAEQSAPWRQLHRRYRQFLALDRRRSRGEKEGGTRNPGVRAFTENQAREILDAGGSLSEAEMLRCKVRYLADGLVLGGRDFVETVFQLSKRRFPPGRQSGARKIRRVQTELCTMRDLQKTPIS